MHLSMTFLCFEMHQYTMKPTTGVKSACFWMLMSCFIMIMLHIKLSSFWNNSPSFSFKQSSMRILFPFQQTYTETSVFVAAQRSNQVTRAPQVIFWRLKRASSFGVFAAKSKNNFLFFWSIRFLPFPLQWARRTSLWNLLCSVFSFT